jgi:hypothetical protein
VLSTRPGISNGTVHLKAVTSRSAASRSCLAVSVSDMLSS